MNHKAWLRLLACIVILVIFASTVASQNNVSSAANNSALVQVKQDGKLSSRLEMLSQSSVLQNSTQEVQAQSLSLPAQGAGSLGRRTWGNCWLTYA